MFDVTDPNHRKWVGEFTLTNSWKNCPVQFTMNGMGNLALRMQMELLTYYLTKNTKNKT